MSKLGYKQLVAAAEARIKTISAGEAIELLGADDVVFVDLRDVRELKREGGIPGAFHCPRGLLEFWIDPESPYHHAVFAEPKEFIFFCNLGWRSALAADIAQLDHLAARQQAIRIECCSPRILPHVQIIAARNQPCIAE